MACSSVLGWPGGRHDNGVKLQFRVEFPLLRLADELAMRAKLTDGTREFAHIGCFPVVSADPRPVTLMKRCPATTYTARLHFFSSQELSPCYLLL